MARKEDARRSLRESRSVDRMRGVYGHDIKSGERKQNTEESKHIGTLEIKTVGITIPWTWYGSAWLARNARPTLPRLPRPVMTQPDSLSCTKAKDWKRGIALVTHHASLLLHTMRSSWQELPFRVWSSCVFVILQMEVYDRIVKKHIHFPI